MTAKKLKLWKTVRNDKTCFFLFTTRCILIIMYRWNVPAKQPYTMNHHVSWHSIGYTLLKIIGLVCWFCRCPFALLTSSRRRTVFVLPLQQRPMNRPEVKKGEKPAIVHAVTCNEMPSWFKILCQQSGNLPNCSYKTYTFKGCTIMWGPMLQHFCKILGFLKRDAER
jgi:hypothetical protein